MRFDAQGLVGRVLGGRYRVERVLGAGGMGMVFAARQLDLDRHVALKVLFDQDPRALARLRQEAAAAGALASPHVVSVYDFNAGDPPFVVMELLPGESLATVVARQGRLAPQMACFFVRQMLAGLDVAHRAGLVHRDIKPSNVWIVPTTNGDVVKLLDFGIVKRLGEPGSQAPATTKGAVLGTPAFLAPEQIQGLPVDARTDLHAVGVVLYRLITGELPWQGRATEAFDVILHVTPPPMHASTPGVPQGLSAIVARALAKTKEQRFGSAAEMSAALAPFAEGLPARPASYAPGPAPVPVSVTASTRTAPAPPSPMPDERRARSASPALYVLAGGGLAFGIGGIGVAVWFATSAHSTTAPTGSVDASALPVAIALTTLDAGATGLDASPPSPPSGPASAGAPTRVRLPQAGIRRATKADRFVCTCVDAFHKRVVCPEPSTPDCTCEDEPMSPLCNVPYKDRTCAVSDRSAAYSGRGRKSGDPCQGFPNTTDSAPSLKQGRLNCDVCIGSEMDWVGVTPESRCRGVNKQGLLLDGFWRCAAR